MIILRIALNVRDYLEGPGIKSRSFSTLEQWFKTSYHLQFVSNHTAEVQTYAKEQHNQQERSHSIEISGSHGATSQKTVIFIQSQVQPVLFLIFMYYA
jgi:hypothetical protein